MNNRSFAICPKCKEKQTLAINDFSQEELTFDNGHIDALENDKTKINCCIYCNTSFFGSNEE